MDDIQCPGSDVPASPPYTHSDVAYEFPLSPLATDNADVSSIEEDSKNNDSGVNTASDPISDEVEPLDREAATAVIMTVLDNNPQIVEKLLEWARIFIEENPEMLTRSSTIVDAYPDLDKSSTEFERGIKAICRIISDDRLRTVRDYAAQLEGEWITALIEGPTELEGEEKVVIFSDFIDLVYSEAERVMEKGEGWYREDEDVEVVGSVFGFREKDVLEEEDGAMETRGEDVMGAEG